MNKQRFHHNENAPAINLQDCSKITDDVDDTKHKTAARDHGKVGSIIIARDGTTREHTLLVEGTVDGIIERIDLFAFGGIVRYGRIQIGVDLIGTVNLDVNDEDE